MNNTDKNTIHVHLFFALQTDPNIFQFDSSKFQSRGHWLLVFKIYWNPWSCYNLSVKFSSKYPLRIHNNNSLVIVTSSWQNKMAADVNMTYYRTVHKYYSSEYKQTWLSCDPDSAKKSASAAIKIANGNVLFSV